MRADDEKNYLREKKNKIFLLSGFEALLPFSFPCPKKNQVWNAARTVHFGPDCLKGKGT